MKELRPVAAQTNVLRADINAFDLYKICQLRLWHKCISYLFLMKPNDSTFNTFIIYAWGNNTFDRQEVYQ